MSERITLAYQSPDGRETITLAWRAPGSPCIAMQASEPALVEMVEAGLIEMRSRDGKIVDPLRATSADWMRLLELRYGQVEPLDGEMTLPETTDPQDDAERQTPSEAAP